MNAIHIQELQQCLPQTLDQVCDDHEPMIITRAGKQAVLISHEDYSALQETLYLLSSPVMAQRLRESLASFQQGQGVERDLIAADE
ncbi:type II toxin-antitoxin system Phd/YefM family antitoxin [Candidatus Venteria ishoeyi]|uniref:Antitoxin n=1 Tax=Candidatus Venteria ishoeyi TaxID=1899563 RepID=A0A1H6F7V5_9GAMM|nr:type II toxin-antitoxin system prevent-host-death family antitoxin [Candidatus Venteria ishoeyi]SEH05399.1 Antitoxin YefM [Candidatus Venteria ishoeyi]